MISMSGAFSVTFSVIFAYVADVTDERERSTAYGLVSTGISLSSPFYLVYFVDKRMLTAAFFIHRCD